MKKLLLILAFIITVVTSGFAQNANRSGVFLEAGAGTYFGKLPLSRIQWKDNKLSVLKVADPDINFALGYRRATSRVFAWEIRVEGAIDGNVSSATVVAVMPGFRFTTKEIFGNTSVYFGLNLGVALGTSQYFDYIILNQDSNSSNDLDAYGGKILLYGGLNITHSFYAGVYLNLNGISDQMSEFGTSSSGSDFLSDKGLNLWGSFALRLGYRF